MVKSQCARRCKQKGKRRGSAFPYQVRPGPLSPSLVTGDLVAVVAQAPRAIDPARAAMRLDLAGATARELVGKPIGALQAAGPQDAARVAVPRLYMTDALRGQGLTCNPIGKRLWSDNLRLVCVVIVGDRVPFVAVVDRFADDGQRRDACEGFGEVIPICACGGSEGASYDNCQTDNSGDEVTMHWCTPLFRSGEVPEQFEHRLGPRVSEEATDKQYRQAVIRYHAAKARKLLYICETARNLLV